MKQLRALLLSVLLSWSAAGVQALTSVLIVSSDNTAAYADAAQVLITSLERAGVSRYDVRLMSPAELAASQSVPESSSSRVIVALGAVATEALARANLKPPVLSALIPRGSFERILRVSNSKPSPQLTALYLDQPLLRQLALIRLALPQAQRLGVLLGPESSLKAVALRELAAAKGLEVQESRIETSAPAFTALPQLLDGSDVFLALADPQVFNSASIQNILLATFRAKVPMVAFSPAYVRAGALLSLHTTAAQAGTQAAELVLEVLRGKSLPGRPVEPNDFEVSVNEHVARALNFTLDATALRLELRRLERLP